MGTGDLVPGDLALILGLFLGQEVGDVGLLQQRVTCVLLVAQDRIHQVRVPLTFGVVDWFTGCDELIDPHKCGNLRTTKSPEIILSRSTACRPSSSGSKRIMRR